MTKEQSFFIQILSDHLNGRETKHVDGLDWNVIHSYALKHQVSGIVFEQARESMPAEIQKTFWKETMATILYAVKRDSEIDSIKRAFIENEISFFVVKGPAIACLYPSPKLRSMGDIDLVIHRADRNTCHEILLLNGYECRTKQDNREWQYYKNGIELELHDRLVYDEAVNEKGQDAFFNDCWQYVQEGELAWNFHLLFLIFHLRKHFMNSGVGFRMFMDLAVVISQIDIDWNWMENHLKTTGLYKFTKTCYGFIFRWFGIRSFFTEQIDDDFYEEATRKIIDDGVFGFDNTENKGNLSVNIIRNNKHPKLSLLVLHVKEIFPSWKTLSATETYKYLQNSRLLLPVAWIHRLFRNAGKEEIKTRMKVASLNGFDKRMTWMKKWGLL